MKNNQSIAQVKIEAITPLHVGSGEQLSSVGDFFTTQNTVYFIDNDRLMQPIARAGRMDEYVNSILETGIGLDFYEVLEKKWGIVLSDFSKRELPLRQAYRKPSNNDILYMHARTAGKPYLPGSSLKGVFRTALLYRFLQDDFEAFDALADYLCEKGARPDKYFFAALARRFEKDYFSPDLFRNLRLTDSSPVDDEHIAVVQMQRVSFHEESESGASGVDWLSECIMPGAELFFECSLRALGKRNGDFLPGLSDFTIKALFEVLNAYTEQQINLEIDLLEKKHQNKALSVVLIEKLKHLLQEVRSAKCLPLQGEAIVRLGKGKTLFYQTLLPLLYERNCFPSALLEYLKIEDTDEFPRTRVLAVGDKDMCGWARLTYELIEGEGGKTSSEELVALPKVHTDNRVERIDVGMTLHALFTGLKQVEILLNGELISCQLINKEKRTFPLNTAVKIVVHQVSKSGKIIQVKLKS